MKRTKKPPFAINNRNSKTDSSRQGASDLTELEGAALGIVWKNGPCSAYAVMRAFATSASSSWSAGAGAVYPALNRLERGGLIAAADAGRRRMLQVSAEGLRALRDWLTVQPWMGSMTSDPLRTRTFFLDVLPNRADQIEFITRAEGETRAAVVALLDRIEGLPKGMEKYGSTGSLFELKARLRWLRWMRRALISAAKHPDQAAP